MTTQYTVSDVWAMHQQDLLDLAPEFQRNSVWPRRAKAYFIDTLLQDLPVPLLIVERTVSGQTGKSRTSVIDGQQRLRAIVEFIEGEFRLTQSDGAHWAGRRYLELEDVDKHRLLGYPLLFQVLEGYSAPEIRDIFVRLNRFVVRLAPQELRHAREPGAFSRFVERLGAMPYWSENRIFTETQHARMRPVEFAAELVILLTEGPQDKKAAIDLYYDYFDDEFPEETVIEARLEELLTWISTAIELPRSRFRRAVDFYGLVGALDRIADHGDGQLPDVARARTVLAEFERMFASDDPPRDLLQYRVAASRQTDNLAPRMTRIDALERRLRQA